MHGATLSSVVVLDGSQVYIGVCVHAAHVKKFAASIQNDDSSIATLQEDERNKLRVSVCVCVWVCACVQHRLVQLHVCVSLCVSIFLRRLKSLRLALMS